MNFRMLKRWVAWCVAAAVMTGRTLAEEAGAEDARALFGNTALEFFQKGGVLMWPILVCSVVALAFVLERMVALRAAHVFPRRLHREALELVRAARTDEARALCARSGSSFGRLAYMALSRADVAGFEMEAALEEAGGRELYDLRKNARPLGVVADVAPLLGLMGTVLGMIKAFEVVARSGALGRTELLAEGIGEALITTAFGLSVAIPSLVAHQYFRGKAEGLLRTMEDACLEIVNEVRHPRIAA